jgi:hypothetical protein
MKTADVAELLDKSEKTVRKLADEEFLPCRVIPGRKKMYIWDRQRIEDWLRGEQEERRYEINLT